MASRSFHVQEKKQVNLIEGYSYRYTVASHLLS